MTIYYNTEDKQVVIILGYGIGNHLSVKYLKGIVKDIRELFPMSIAQGEDLVFLEVADSSRRHKHNWYTRFHYDLSANKVSEYGYIIVNETTQVTAFPISSKKNGENGWMHADETAAESMNRMIHS